ncbi:MAG: tetratricopeptide repeat protein [Verrucomicrobia bacterium]|nr:tetratricopeptide repeat protein [Verrucomicrobiota bacterium]
MESETVTAGQVDWMKWLDWVVKNKRRVALWGGAALGVILVTALIVYEMRQKEVRASLALAKVDLPIPPGKSPPPNAVETLLKVAQDHPSTHAAARALLQAATLRFAEGQYPEAEALFGRFEKNYPESPWLPQALLGQAASLEAQTKTSEALAGYERLRKIYPTDVIVTDVQLGLARIYEHQDKPADAKKLYEDILQVNHPRSSPAVLAGLRLQAILKEHPELAKTNAPPIASPVVPPVGATNIPPKPATNQPALSNAAPASPLPHRPATNVPVPTPATTNAPTPSILTNITKPATVLSNVLKPAAVTNGPKPALK